MRFRTAGGMLVVIISIVGMVVATAGCGGMSDDAAAQVNGVEITKAQVDKRISDLRRSYGPLVPQEDLDGDGELDEEYTNYRRDVTHELVREELERQEAEKHDVTVSQQEIDEAMQLTADESFLGDVDRLKQSYYDRGFNEEDLNADMARAIMHQKLTVAVVGEIEITDQDIQDFYNRNITQYQSPERRTARQLITQDEVTAQQAVSRARAGEDFITLVRELSVDPAVEDRIGSLGLVKSGDLAPELDKVVFSLQPLQISDPVKLGEQWYVLTVEAIVPAVDVPLESVKDELRILAQNDQIATKWRDFQARVLDESEIEYNPDYDPDKKAATATGTTATTVE